MYGAQGPGGGLPPASELLTPSTAAPFTRPSMPSPQMAPPSPYLCTSNYQSLTEPGTPAFLNPNSVGDPVASPSYESMSPATSTKPSTPMPDSNGMYGHYGSQPYYSPQQYQQPRLPPVATLQAAGYSQVGSQRFPPSYPRRTVQRQQHVIRQDYPNDSTLRQQLNRPIQKPPVSSQEQRRSQFVSQSSAPLASEQPHSVPAQSKERLNPYQNGPQSVPNMHHSLDSNGKQSRLTKHRAIGVGDGDKEYYSNPGSMANMTDDTEFVQPFQLSTEFDQYLSPISTQPPHPYPPYPHSPLHEQHQTYQQLETYQPDPFPQPPYPPPDYSQPDGYYDQNGVYVPPEEPVIYPQPAPPPFDPNYPPRIPPGHQQVIYRQGPNGHVIQSVIEPLYDSPMIDTHPRLSDHEVFEPLPDTQPTEHLMSRSDANAPKAATSPKKATKKKPAQSVPKPQASSTPTKSTQPLTTTTEPKPKPKRIRKSAAQLRAEKAAREAALAESNNQNGPSIQQEQQHARPAPTDDVQHKPDQQTNGDNQHQSLQQRQQPPSVQTYHAQQRAPDDGRHVQQEHVDEVSHAEPVPSASFPQPCRDNSSALMPPPKVDTAPSVVAAKQAAAQVSPSKELVNGNTSDSDKPNGTQSQESEKKAPPKRIRTAAQRAEQQRLRQLKLRELEVAQAREDHEYLLKYMHLRKMVRALVFTNTALADEVSRVKMQIDVVTDERRIIAKEVRHNERKRIRRMQTHERKAKAKREAEERDRQSSVAGEPETSNQAPLAELKLDVKPLKLTKSPAVSPAIKRELISPVPDKRKPPTQPTPRKRPPQPIASKSTSQNGSETPEPKRRRLITKKQEADRPVIPASASERPKPQNGKNVTPQPCPVSATPTLGSPTPPGWPVDQQFLSPTERPDTPDFMEVDQTPNSSKSLQNFVSDSKKEDDKETPKKRPDQDKSTPGSGESMRTRFSARLQKQQQDTPEKPQSRSQSRSAHNLSPKPQATPKAERFTPQPCSSNSLTPNEQKMTIALSRLNPTPDELEDQPFERILETESTLDHFDEDKSISSTPVQTEPPFPLPTSDPRKRTSSRASKRGPMRHSNTPNSFSDSPTPSTSTSPVPPPEAGGVVVTRRRAAEAAATPSMQTRSKRKL